MNKTPLNKLDLYTTLCVMFADRPLYQKTLEASYRYYEDMDDGTDPDFDIKHDVL